MPLRVTNTLTGEQEPFEPGDPDDVRLYYCGLTVSDPPHLGHARCWVHVDVMHRWLEHLGYGVDHVENFTDVNEKIVARVGEAGDDEAAVARHYIAEALDAMRALNLRRATVYPRVTDHLPEILDLVATLVDDGVAYESNGSVYFDVTAFPGYGALSNLRLDDLEAQGDPDERAEKRHPADFALWKADGVGPAAIAEHRHEGAADPEVAAATAETFDSPWGPGRPGWHIECSAMAMCHLGETVDLHVGGRDLVFPHHENERAQSEAATGRPFARYWLHCSLFEFGDEKMSSSLGNFVTVADAVDAVGADALRMLLLSATYNATQTYSEAAVEEAVERWERLERAYRTAVEALDGPDAGSRVADEALRSAVDATHEAFDAAMNDDFNTREALAALFELAAASNRHVDGADRYDYRGLRRTVETFEDLAGGVLGFDLAGDATGRVDLADELVELVLAVREEARAAGDFERADALRDELEALGVAVEDAADGPTFRY